MMNKNNQHNLKRVLLLCNALFKNKFISFLVIGAVALILFLSSQSPYQSISITDMKSGKVYWQTDIKAGEWFYHQYIHSVEQSLVIEKFKVDELGRMLTMESWTRSFGAGLPYAAQGNVEITEDGFYVMRDLNRLVHGGHLNMHPSDLFPHTFHFRDYELMLSEPPYARNNIRIAIKPANWFNALIMLMERR